MGDINVTTSDGRVGSLPEADAARAVSAGQARYATPEEIAGAKAAVSANERQKTYGGFVGQHVAQGVGVLRGLSGAMGVPLDAAAVDATWLVSPSAAEGLREGLSNLKEANPVGSAIGEFAGSIAPAAFGDEAGPINALGSAMERRAASAAGRALGSAAAGTAGKVASRAISLGARGAAEGSVMGAVDAINESALQDKELSAEALLAGAKGGALGGAIVGGVLGGGGELFGAARRGLSSALSDISVGFRPGESKLIGAMHDAYVNAASATTGADASTIRALTSLTEEGARARKIAVSGADDVINGAARAVREHGDALLAADRAVADEARGALKADYVRRAVRTGNEAETAARAQEQLAALINAAEDRLTTPNGVGFTKSVESVSRASYEASEKIAAAIRSGEDVNAKIFTALDGVKRDVQRLAKNAFHGVQNVADPLERRLSQDSADWFRSAAEDLRVGLEDEGLWGKAATDQRKINAAWTRQIDASGRFHSALTTEVGRDPLNPYLKVRGVDPAKAESYVRGITNANKDLTHQAVKDYLQSTQDLAHAISESYDLPAEKIAGVDTIHKSADALRSVLSGSEKDLQTVNSFRALKEAEKNSGISTLSGMLGGGAFAGPAGSIVGAAAGSVSNPAKVIQQMSAIEGLTRSRVGTLLEIERRTAAVTSKIESGIRAFVEGGSAIGKSVKRSPDKLYRLFGGEDRPDSGSKRDRFERLIVRIDRASKVPSVQAQHIATAVQKVHDHAPVVGMVAAERVQRSIDFLASKIPPGIIDHNALQPQTDRARWTDAQMSKFLRYVEAADSPLTVLDDLAQHRLTREQVETIKTLNPRLYEVMQRAALSSLADSKRVPYQSRIQLGMLLDVPADRTLSPDFVKAVQSTFSDQSPPAGGNMGGGQVSHPTLAQSARTDMERVEGS